MNKKIRIKFPGFIHDRKQLPFWKIWSDEEARRINKRRNIVIVTTVSATIHLFVNLTLCERRCTREKKHTFSSFSRSRNRLVFILIFEGLFEGEICLVNNGGSQWPVDHVGHAYTPCPSAIPLSISCPRSNTHGDRYFPFFSFLLQLFVISFFSLIFSQLMTYNWAGGPRVTGDQGPLV